MLSSYMLSLREGLEAALIIGILLGALRKMHRQDLASATWTGTLAALLVSALAAFGLNSLNMSLQDPGEAIFEGFTMLLAAAILTWMLFWMRGQSRNLRTNLEGDLHAASRNGKRGVFLLAFLAVLREGVELALFLTASAFSSDAIRTLGGALLGLATAVLLGILLFATTIRLNIERFFQVTGILLVLFAAGLVAHSVHEFNEVGWIPAGIEHLWDVNYLLNEKSTLGTMLTSLLGYNGNPSLSEVLSYVGYFIAVFLGLLTSARKVRLKPADNSSGDVV